MELNGSTTGSRDAKILKTDYLLPVSMEGERDCQFERKLGRILLSNVLSCMYAVILVLISLAFRLSTPLLQIPANVYLPFHTYLYVVCLLYFAYCAVGLLHEFPCDRFSLKWLVDCGRLGSSGSENETIVVNNNHKVGADEVKPKISYHAPSAASLFLLLGATVFGIVCIISNIIELAAIFENCNVWTNSLRPLNAFLEILFILVQSCFIFTHAKLVILKRKHVSRFGIMHLVATNLCIWIQSILTEEFHLVHALENEEEEVKTGSTHLPTPQSHYNNTIQNQILWPGCQNDLKYCIDLKMSRCAWFPDSNSLEQIFTTCLVEFSMIGAAVLFILWLNIGTTVPTAEDGRNLYETKNRKQHYRVDCSSSSSGFFASLLFCIVVIASMMVFFVKIRIPNQQQNAMTLFYATNVFIYLFTLSASIGAFYQTRRLRFVTKIRHHVMLLDDILLITGLIGQLMFCVFALVPMTMKELMTPVGMLRTVGVIMRIMQVLTQTVLILGAERLEATNGRKTGRQLITFLVISNIAIWLVNTIQTQEVMTNNAMTDIYGEKVSWSSTMEMAVPICTFFRFHSSVCLAEIWKKCYKSQIEEPDHQLIDC